MVARAGFFATISRESRQARKGATVTVMSSAEESPARATTLINPVLVSSSPLKKVGSVATHELPCSCPKVATQAFF